MANRRYGSVLSGCLTAACGNGNDSLQLIADSLVHSNPGGTAVVGIRIDSDGQIYTRSAGGGYVAQYVWVLPALVANYECRWVTGGTTPDTVPAASGTWVQCNVDRTFEESEAGADKNYDFTLEIGRNGTSVALKSVTIGFHALGSP